MRLAGPLASDRTSHGPRPIIITRRGFQGPPRLLKPSRVTVVIGRIRRAESKKKVTDRSGRRSGGGEFRPGRPTGRGVDRERVGFAGAAARGVDGTCAGPGLSRTFTLGAASFG